jgi:phosphatidate cytidylyltransferase
MKQRLITAAVILGVTIPLVLFSDFITYPIALSLLAVVAINEVLKALSAEKEYYLAVPAYILAAVLPFASYFAWKNSLIYLLSLAALVFTYLVYTMAVGVFSRGRLGFAMISELYVMVAYVVVSFSSMSLIRFIDKSVGLYLLILVFVVAWVTDSCAYIIGSLFGKHKLIPEVSPKKSVEGAVGGLICAVLAFIVYGVIIDVFFEEINVNYVALIVFAPILSAVSQLGDLFASLLKRQHGIKDYGTLFPGHGGVMDRFDSNLAVSTVLLILSQIIAPFTIA